MTVYYYEGSPIVAPLTIESNEPVFVADSVSLKQQRASQGAQRWELSFQIQTRDNEEDLLIGLVTDLGSAKTMIMPQLMSVDKKNTLTAQGVPAATTAGVEAVTVTFSQTGLLPKGSFISFSNHTKIYLVKSNINAVINTPISIPIYPALRSNISTSDRLYHGRSSVKPTFRYFRDLETLQGIVYEDGILVNPGTIRVIEAL